MGDIIIGQDTIRRMAREAFERGDPRDSHGFNWHAPALNTWLEEYDRQAKLAPAGQRRVDVRQGCQP